MEKHDVALQKHDVPVREKHDVSVLEKPVPLFENPHAKMLQDAIIPFQPKSSDIDDLRAQRLISRTISDGITREDLIMVAQTTTDYRQKSTAQYLSKHFDDVVRLSSGKSKNIESEDLSMYKDLLAQRSLRPNELAVRTWEKIHYDSEIRKNTPGAGYGTIAGTLAGIATNVAAIQLLSLRFTPLTVIGSAVNLMAWSTAGRAIGNNIEGRREQIQLHFIDEAAPAMQRLLFERKARS